MPTWRMYLQQIFYEIRLKNNIREFKTIIPKKRLNYPEHTSW